MTYQVGDTVSVKFAGDLDKSEVVIEKIEFVETPIFEEITFPSLWINGREVGNFYGMADYAGYPG